MLQVSPKMINRLDDLEADLITRRARAQAEGWAGELEGLDLTLQLLRAKREDSRRRTGRPLVDLGLPRFSKRKKGQ
ncbi:recombinase [Streptomyces sp. NPDC088124]|uniref:recombinase n=1 Tax=Streptomyces sp. NPDC088124 TaxID=3154654 RepID=UPI00343A5BF3